jgi:hypothetical protein
VGVTGLALMGVFYAVLLVTMPSALRQQFLARSRGAVGRLTGRLHG